MSFKILNKVTICLQLDSMTLTQHGTRHTSNAWKIRIWHGGEITVY